MIKLYHNPKCSTSRKVLALLEAKGWRVEVIEYLKTPLTQKELTALAALLPNPADLLRTKEAKAAGLTAVTPPAAIIKAIAAEPVLLNRPIVATKDKAVAARPPETALEILDK